MTKDLMCRHVQESSRRTVVVNSQKASDWNRYDIHENVTFRRIADIVTKHWSSPWFYQEALALMGLIRLICLLLIYT
jgi:hypothetical protein